MSAALEAYKRAFHCGVGGHDFHLCDENDKMINPDDQVYDDRCALAVAWSMQRRALESIAFLINTSGSQEMETARLIAKNALMDHDEKEK